MPVPGILAVLVVWWCTWVGCAPIPYIDSPYPLTDGSHIAEDAPDEPEPVTVVVDSGNTGMGNMSKDVTRWEGLVSGYFPPGQVPVVLCLIKWESGGNPTALNASSGARGLLQIMPMWAEVYGYSYSDLDSPEVSLAIAADLQAEYGWGQWNAYWHWNGESCS